MFRCLGHCGRLFASQFERVEHMLVANHEQGVQIMGSLENLMAANEAEKAELVTFLQDIAGKLDGHDDAAIQAVADDITARVAQLQAADPGTPASTDPGTDVPPADGDTPPATDGSTDTSGDDSAEAQPAQ